MGTIVNGLSCLAAGSAACRPLFTARPEALDAALEALSPAARRYAQDAGFRAESQELLLLPQEARRPGEDDSGAIGSGGIGAALLGLGADRSPYAFGDLPGRLPGDTDWHLVPGDYDDAAAVLGFCLGGYRYAGLKAPGRPLARLRPPDGTDAAIAAAAAAWMVRDLINTPANLLGPAELADAAMDLGTAHGAECRRIEGAALAEHYPVLAAVGAGAARPPAVVRLDWRGSGAGRDAPLVALVGKGVVFDTGGYDLKPSAAMLRMKKDMGGAAHALGLARLVMAANLAVRLVVLVGCAENSVSGTAMRPSDVLRSRHGLSIEVGNTDAEGRLLLCDLLAEASALQPRLLIDYATLTGAARVALGPDVPALFCNDDALAAAFAAAAVADHDPLWRLPLWPGYDAWLASPVADLNSVASKPMAGAIVAALFLQRFVAPGVPWAHLDVYAWNDSSRPGRPEGGEAQGLRAALRIITQCANASDVKQNERLA